MVLTATVTKVHRQPTPDCAKILHLALHFLFEERRVNLVNKRREFYENVGLEEIEAFVKDRGLSAQFLRIPEAKEYRESLAIRSQQAAVVPKESAAERFPSSLFQAAAAE